MKLENKVAIVTGGGSGLGFGYAKAMLKEGAKVVIAELNNEVGENAEKELKKISEDVFFVQCDVADESQIDDTVAQTVERFGTVNILINNAQAYKPFDLILNTEADDIRLVNETGPIASLLFIKKCVPYMIESNYGRIINVSSATGIEGTATFGAFAIAKEAIRGLTRVAATEFGEHGITANVIAPGAETPGSIAWMKADPEAFEKTMEPVPMKRLGDVDKDISPVVVFLASEEGRFVTGQTICIDGGHTFVR